MQQQWRCNVSPSLNHIKIALSQQGDLLLSMKPTAGNPIREESRPMTTGEVEEISAIRERLEDDGTFVLSPTPRQNLRPRSPPPPARVSPRVGQRV